MAEVLRSWRERIGAPLREALTAPFEPCWSSGCTNAAAKPNPRWKGRYCQPCATDLEVDAERIAAEFTREAVSA